MPSEARNRAVDARHVEGESQAHRAYRAIEQMIVSLELAPGSRISEQSLSASLNIGRTPVREALQRLAREGSIKVLPRSGAVVLNIDVEDHFKLIEVRREVERILIGRSARLADAGVRKAFTELRDRFNKAAETDDEAMFMAADQEFNSLVARTADNAYAAYAMAPLQAQTRRFWFLNFQKFGDLATVCRLHAAIAERIAANDEPAARKASDRLIDYVEEYTYLTMRALRGGS
ncbi:MAG TPA: GntR family transcriptional regulator [Nocardioidaceae bacterium]|nr:GntR family transcriptional regulator [Nocardioidaceae bacterium]